MGVCEILNEKMNKKEKQRVYEKWIGGNLENLEREFVEENPESFEDFCKREWIKREARLKAEGEKK